jgi:hypothetical protein
VRAQQLVHLVREPARIAELERVAARCQRLERRGENVVVSSEVRRELPEQRAELAGLA